MVPPFQTVSSGDQFQYQCDYDKKHIDHGILQMLIDTFYRKIELGNRRRSEGPLLWKGLPREQ
jgi:hypothetical protein